MSNLVRSTQKAVAKSEGSIAPVVGIPMMVGGGSALAVVTLAAFLPFGVFTWAIVLLVLGGILTLKG